MNCYVTNIRQNSEYPPMLNKDNTLFYPETRMTTDDCFKTSRPSEFHIVTDCPFLVGLYEQKEVFIWRNGKWVNPEINTYGCSFNLIIMEIFNYDNTIPQAVVDGETTNCMGYNRKK